MSLLLTGSQRVAQINLFAGALKLKEISPSHTYKCMLRWNNIICSKRSRTKCAINLKSRSPAAAFILGFELELQRPPSSRESHRAEQRGRSAAAVREDLQISNIHHGDKKVVHK